MMFRRLIGMVAMVGAVVSPSLVTAQGPAPTIARPAAIAQPALRVTPPPGGAPALTRADVDTWLDGFMPYALADGDIAGATVVVVKDGAILTSRGFGYADIAKRAPVDPARTLMRPGSISKLFVWTAVMQQVERGKLNLDADVNQYLDFKIPPRDGKPITLRQIMTHRAGFEEAAKDIIFHDPKRLMPIDAYLKRWIPKRVFAPGTVPAYSNWATTLAGYIVQRVSNEPFEVYVERNIFAPLRMTNATFRQPLPARFTAQAAQGYGRASGKPIPFELVGPAPAGSLSITGDDMARFMLAHLNGGEYDGGRILSPATTAQMHAAQPGGIANLNRMALGFFESNINNRRVIGHLGDSEAFHSALHLFPAENVGLYLSLSSAGDAGAAGKIRIALFDAFADRYFPSSGRPIVAGVDDATARQHAAMMAGNWSNTRGSQSSFMALVGLLGQMNVSSGPKGELIVPALKGFGGGVRKWVEVSPFLWADPMSHERLGAEVKDGKVVRFAMDQVAPVMEYHRTPAARSSSWLLPALYVALAVMALTAVLWPIRAIVRRRFKGEFAMAPQRLRAFRASRIMAIATVLVLVGWLTTVTVMSADTNSLGSAMDPALWMLQIAGAVVFVGGVAIMAWNLWAAWTTPAGWPGRIWAILLLLSALVILWIAYAFGLMAMSVNY